MRYDAVIFDHDGVLVGLTDAAVLREAIGDTYRSLGVDDPSEADYEGLWVGTTVDEVAAAAERHGLDPETLWQRRDRTISAREQAEIRAGRKALYDDVVSLHALDRPAGIVSNNVEPTIRFGLDHHGLTDTFDVVYGRESSLDGLRRRKPDPYYLHRAVDALDVRRPLYVGDSGTDVEAAQRAGVDAAFLRRPERSTTPAIDPTHELRSLADVATLLRTREPHES